MRVRMTCSTVRAEHPQPVYDFSGQMAGRGAIVRVIPLDGICVFMLGKLLFCILIWRSYVVFVVVFVVILFQAAHLSVLN